MLLLVTDAFAQAVEEARIRLARTEGHNISIRELARRANVNYRTLHYNLSPERQATGRRIDPQLVHALAQVLPISEDELMRAAQVAAGYQVSGPEMPDLGAAVVRFLDDEEIPEAEKRQLRSRLADILAEEMRKAADAQNGNAL